MGNMHLNQPSLLPLRSYILTGFQLSSKWREWQESNSVSAVPSVAKKAA